MTPFDIIIVCDNNRATLPPLPSHHPPPMPICKCSRCIKSTYLENNVERQGQMQPSREYKLHMAQDKIREAATSRAQETVANTILLQTLQLDPTNPTARLPVRPSDLSNEDSSAQPSQAPKEVKPVSPQRVVHSAVLSNPLQDKHAIRERFALVARLDSRRSLKCQTLPAEPRLIFKTAPTSFTDPPGDLDGTRGDNLVFDSYYNWLRTEIWAVGELGPVGDNDADGRFIGEVKKLREELERLATLKARAWRQLMYQTLCAGDAEARDVPVVNAGTYDRIA